MKQGCAGNTAMLADELSNTRIHVNSFNPGPVATKIRLPAFPAEDRDALTKPEDVLSSYMYLLSAEGRGVTGQHLS